ncbi:MAG: hypothetical protein IPM63_11705 [Acidobacteriota bacterium]|nr:MAG: hypothetical protein IPM63_11705 [Acidobacteriota bacterium]
MSELTYEPVSGRGSPTLTETELKYLILELEILFPELDWPVVDSSKTDAGA